MPPALLTAQQARDAQAGATSDLKFILADNGVDELHQVVLFHAGYDKVSVVVGLGENRGEVRAAMTLPSTRGRGRQREHTWLKSWLLVSMRARRCRRRSSRGPSTRW